MEIAPRKSTGILRGLGPQKYAPLKSQLIHPWLKELKPWNQEVRGRTKTAWLKSGNSEPKEVNPSWSAYTQIAAVGTNGPAITHQSSFILNESNCTRIFKS